MNIIKFKRNRVRRNYRGGKGIDELQQEYPPRDSDRPEEWIASTVAANNHGLEPIQYEGLSFMENNQLFVEFLQKNPIRHLGEAHYQRHGLNLGFLVKLLDSSMRLHTQAHPTREFAKQFMNADWGKFEAYYILNIRNSEEGYIRLGFQNVPTKQEWKDIIEKQDIDKMDQCFKKVPIKRGDVIFIPGGVPHAIGENVLMVEIMEPSDLVIRCEFERKGITVPKGARFMGRNLAFCLNVFDYTEYSVEEIQTNFFLDPECLSKDSNILSRRLVPASIANSFEVFSLQFKGTQTFDLDERFLVGICISGKVTIKIREGLVEFQPGDSFFISSAETKATFHTGKDSFSEICIVSNVR